MFALQGVELAKRLMQVMIGDLVVFDVEALEDRLVQQASLLLVAPSVELLGGFQELEGGLDELGAVGEVGAGGVEPLSEATSLGGDLAELGFDLGLRQCAVGGEVDQVLLLGVEFSQLAGNLLVQQTRGGFLLVDHGVDVRADIGDELWPELDVGVVAFDGFFDLVGVDVRARA